MRLAAILVGIGALLGAAFILGLLVGYDVGRESQSRAAQIATAKPVSAKHPKAAAGATAPEAAPSSERMATEAPPSTGEVRAPGAGADTGDEAGGSSESSSEAGAIAAPVAHAAASANPAPGVHARHKPYNIQIEAAMDRGGANEMVHRLQELGYQPHLVRAQMKGQTRYKVVIGPYATQEAAAAAQQEIRTKYNNIYSSGAAAGAGAPNPSD
jgi:sporulation related protein